jgi:hypothetical protein
MPYETNVLFLTFFNVFANCRRNFPGKTKNLRLISQFFGRVGIKFDNISGGKLYLSAFIIKNIHGLRQMEVTSHCNVSINFSLNDLLGGRGWWLVKGAQVRGPFLLPGHKGTFSKNIPAIISTPGLLPPEFRLPISLFTFAYMDVDNMEYNTTRNQLVMREYGRHVQKMIEHILTIEDPERRQGNAQAAIELMGFLNPHLKNVEDFRHKLWDHLFLIADFKLDVKSPYPIPTRETLRANLTRFLIPSGILSYYTLAKTWK